MFFLLDTLPPDRFFGLDAQALIQTGANAFVLIILGIIITKVLYAPVRNFMRERSDRIQGQLDDARDSKAAASDLKHQYDRQLKDIEVERAAILEEARKLANEQRNHILDAAKDEARLIKEQAGVEIEAERERVRNEIHAAIVDISTDMAEKLLAAAIDQKAHERLFDEGLAELERVVFS